MSAQTPGQAAFAEYYGRQAGASLDMPASWDAQSDATRADWEAAAECAIDTYMFRVAESLGAAQERPS